MRVLFHLGHPAHYHLFKNAIKHLKDINNKVDVLIKKKDILENLLEEENIVYKNIFPKTRGDSLYAIAKTIIKRDLRLFRYCIKHKPDLLVGTSVECSHISKLLNIPFINFNEDDHNVVPYYSKFSYPFSTSILAPSTCSTGKWEDKTIHYEGYHELAYLHPNNFNPDIKVAKKYVNITEPYFIIRFAKLSAHHDKGINGLTKEVASKIIQQLFPYGNVYITSEKPLDREFELFRLNINPIDMHHVMSYASLYIGDSQTMAAEAGVLGTPFIRFNDFVGRIGYLNELEQKYKLGFGIKPNNKDRLFRILSELLDSDSMTEIFANRRLKMLNEKIDVNQFLIWFVKNFPLSKEILISDPSYQNVFGSKVFSNSTHNSEVFSMHTPLKKYREQTYE